ncbi:hypothetical protein G5574_08010 [Pantoea stewartii]|uniref:hypothetical protein n=1 Tax=Pantoea stewartii TaxID=66269 RepID=UPI0013DE02B2|nr:hypothetical protein [Pantoea stewartii]QIE96905.1 hypothetical protein G5574_08010 [Pantoea stewartii]
MNELAKVLKAYHVQGNEYGVIRFATSNVAARREGAQELDEEFNCVACKRIPGADKYASQGSVPVRALVEELGWWQECAYCNHHVDDETEGRVWDGDTAYCGVECHAHRTNRDRDYQLERQRKEKAERAAVDAAIAEFPGITDVVANHNYKGAIDVYFNFPGGKQRASWVLGSSSVYPAAHEVEAFKSYLASVRPGGAA